MATSWTTRTEPSDSWSRRSKPTTAWDISDLRLGLMWVDLDDSWSSEVRTWAELGNSTVYTIRNKP